MVRGSHGTGLDGAALELRKAVPRTCSSWWLPGEAALEFALDSCPPQPLRNVCLQMTSGSGPTEGIHSLLPSSPHVTQPPRELPQTRACVIAAGQPSKPAAPWLEPQGCVGTSMVSLSPSPQAPGMWLFLAPGPESAPRNPLFSQEDSEGEEQGHVTLKSQRDLDVKPGSASH